MAEEVTITGYAADEDRVSEWELGLPSAEDLTPLSQHLISPELFSAFNITLEPHRSMLEVNRASKNTMSSLRGLSGGLSQSNQFKFKSFEDDGGRDSVDPLVLEADDADVSSDGSDSRKIRRIDEEEADSSMKSSKKIRLVWTPQLHKRFVDVVAHLGIKNAVPKTIMQLMNVEGLTRENVASHLQKYRLYLKRMEGCSNEAPSASDHLFASTPVPPSLHEFGGSSSQAHGNSNGNGNGYVSPYPPQMMPFYGQGLESHLPYNMVQQHRDWSGNNYGPYHS